MDALDAIRDAWKEASDMENPVEPKMSGWLREQRQKLLDIVKWIILALLTGLLCGVVGSAFHKAIDFAATQWSDQKWLLWCLPAAGVAIAGIYRLCGTEGMGTNDILDSIRQGKPVAFLLLPAMFLSTVLTHLCGGSAGREGAALQMGGVIGYHTGRLLALDDQDRRVATMVGMAAFFTALFGTPLAAAIFSVMVVSVGTFFHAALFPALMASLTAYGVSLAMGVPPTRFTVEAPAFDAWNLLRTAGLSVLCAWLSILFCCSIQFTGRQLRRLMSATWMRAAVGGLAVICLTLLSGVRDYNGAGIGIVKAAVEQGTARPDAFLWKILLTAVTLGAGFKGGEVVPAFFVGATFGCTVGPLFGLSAGFGAAVGMISAFCGAVNCPVASTVLAVELFGSDGMLYFALACCVCYICSGYTGIYSSQTILYSKFKASYIGCRVNGKAEEAKEASDSAERAPF